MAGHSHWARIKRKKAVVDARRGKVFSKMAKVITTAARRGGDPSMNLDLRYAIEKAKAANMTNDAIDRAIKKGTGEDGGAALEEVVYEGYGPAGVAVYCEGLTDNRNRTAGEIRKVFELSGGNLAEPNSVAWCFDKKGVITVAADESDEETLFELAVEAGADDVQPAPDGFEITTSVAAFEEVRQALAGREIPTTSSDLTMIPQNTVKLDAEAGEKVMRLIDNLEDHDDIQNVYANFDIPEDVLAQMGEG